MSERGVPLLAGTDTSFLHPPGITLHEELEALVAAGVTTRAVLQAAITNPARLFPSLQTGQVVRGRRADLLLLDGNPLVDIRNTKRIRAVVSGGRLLDRNVLDGMLRDATALAARQ